MTFPNAADGIKKLFIAEVLALISSIAIACSVIFSKPVVSGEEVLDFAATGSEVTIVAILLGIGGIIALIAYILQMVGIAKAAKDEETFKKALYLIIFSILFSIAGSVLAYFYPENTLLSNLGTVGTGVLDFLITFLVIGGIGMLGSKLNDEVLQDKSAKLLRIILLVIVLKVIGNIIVLIFKTNVTETVTTVLGVIILILTLIQYIVYLSLLTTAKRTLATK